jgi:uncharacterized Tic20 family protein
MSLAMPVAAPIPNVAPFFAAADAPETVADRVRAEQPAAAAASVNGRDAGDASFSSPPPPPPSFVHSVKTNGNLHEEGVTDNDRHTAVAMHLSPLAFIWIGPFAMAIPLVLWLIRKDHSRFADDQGRECVNFMISFVVLHFLLALTVVGVALIPVLWVVAVVSLIRGAMTAGRNEYFRYPVTIRFL